MKCKLLLLFTFLLSLNLAAQEYIFGKVSSEDLSEVPNVTVLNMRTDEQVLSNRDGHFMLSGRKGDVLRFYKHGFERADKVVSEENVKSPFNVKLVRAAQLIAEVEVKKGLSGDIKIDSKTMNPPKKVEKLKSDIGKYIQQKSDPRILAARPGEFVQPKGQGFSIGKVKNKWDDLDLTNYLISALGTQYFIDLKIQPSFSYHFVTYILSRGFERSKILKYGFVSDADMNRFQRAVLLNIESYKMPEAGKN